MTNANHNASSKASCPRLYASCCTKTPSHCLITERALRSFVFPVMVLIDSCVPNIFAFNLPSPPPIKLPPTTKRFLAFCSFPPSLRHLGWPSSSLIPVTPASVRSPKERTRFIRIIVYSSSTGFGCRSAHGTVSPPRMRELVNSIIFQLLPDLLALRDSLTTQTGNG